MHLSDGIALIVDTETDNRNRTVAELKHALSKHKWDLPLIETPSQSPRQKNLYETFQPSAVAH